MVRRQTDRAHRRSGSKVVLFWAGLLAMFAAVLFGFPGPTLMPRVYEYFGAVAILTAVAIAARTAPRHRRETSIHERTSAPAIAAAAVLCIAGLAWVYGIFLLYFDIPLVAFVISRWRAERVGGRAG